MAELIHAKQLAWRHLHLLEDPFFAQSDVEVAVNVYEAGAMPGPRGIANFSSWYASLRMPAGNLLNYTLQSLKTGESFYVQPVTRVPKRPLLYRKAGANGLGGSWEVHDYVSAALKNKLNFLIGQISPPKPVVVRQSPGEQSSSTQQDNQRAKLEKHQFVLEIESENDAPLPDDHYVTLVAFNASKDKKIIEQQSDVIYDTDTRVFKAEQGDGFEVFAIPERKKGVLQDLRLNGNLQQSVSENLIVALEEVDTFNRNDGVIVHAMKYVVPENRQLIIEHEYGAQNRSPLHEFFILQHEDSDWIQTIEVTKSHAKPGTSDLGGGWSQLVFDYLPKEGKFTLYSVPADRQSSPVVHFNAVEYDDINNKAELEKLELIDGDEESLLEAENADAAREFVDWLDQWSA